jgi:hypothetical protein
MTAPAPKAAETPVHRLTLRPEPDVADAERALNRLLKVALRTFGFKCVSAKRDATAMTVIPFRPPARRQSATPSRRARGSMDRAAVVASAVLQLRSRHRNGDRSAIPLARLEVEELLRGEFHDIQQKTLNEIRTECE